MKKILVIDDEEDLRIIFSELFKDEDLDVTVASNGIEGLECAMGGAYDLILSDIKMPKLDGIDMLKKMIEQVDNMPEFVFISGGINVNFSELYREFPQIKHIFAKPFDEDHVVDVCVKILNGNFESPERKKAVG